MAKIPVALQLYSAREECAEDLVGTLRAVAEMGYEGVEFAGYYGREAEELRGILDGLGLEVAGTHIGINTLLGDELQRTIEFNNVLGNKFLIVPGLPEEYRNSKSAWLKTAEIMNEVSEKVKPHGMRVGYHNHAVEFQPMEGENPWDIFFGATDEDVVMQLDTGNALYGGGDCVSILERYPGRAITVHLKPYSTEAGPHAEKGFRPLIGEDDILWDDVFRLCETIGGTEWYIVEYESDAYPPLEAVARCLDAIRAMGR
ncbi:MAG: sugar phosphate isomerase/epimerase [Chloroflexota bacterium]|nr:sugar phosphate isomerase/epimerase [Chloroflexota bacterium]